MPQVPAGGRPPVAITLGEFFTIGPGPSSSHTIAPMRAGNDFVRCCRALPPESSARITRLHVELLGSLSATGRGHGTDAAVLAGLLGHEPEQCDPAILPALAARREARHVCVLAGSPRDTEADEATEWCGERAARPGRVSVGFADISFGPVFHDAPHGNTLRFSALDQTGGLVFGKEYYSVGGGFLQWRGWRPPERGVPAHPYASMRELRAQLVASGLTLHELVLENEMSITGLERPAILARLDAVMETMCESVRRGLGAGGTLPGSLGVWRKAGDILERSSALPLPADALLGRLNAYAFAVAEENAAGGTVVTAPTCGSAGVMPALLHAMRHDMRIGERALREGLLASAAVGMLAKHNAGIAGAEVGCQGEIGVASAMTAALLAHARGHAAPVVENAAEIALEHHLGLTCDPVGGYVQIPCIERNAVGAIKAYNSMLIATCEDHSRHRVSLDAAISAMGEIGREMNAKFKETSQGGLAVSTVEC